MTNPSITLEEEISQLRNKLKNFEHNEKYINILHNPQNFSFIFQQLESIIYFQMGTIAQLIEFADLPEEAKNVAISKLTESRNSFDRIRRLFTDHTTSPFSQVVRAPK